MEDADLSRRRRPVRPRPVRAAPCATHRLTEAGFVARAARRRWRGFISSRRWPGALGAGRGPRGAAPLRERTPRGRLPDLSARQRLARSRRPPPSSCRAFYKERKASFRAPEYRAVAVLALNADALAKPEAVSDADARASATSRRRRSSARPSGAPSSRSPSRRRPRPRRLPPDQGGRDFRGDRNRAGRRPGGPRARHLHEAGDARPGGRRRGLRALQKGAVERPGRRAVRPRHRACHGRSAGGRAALRGGRGQIVKREIAQARAKAEIDDGPRRHRGPAGGRPAARRHREGEGPDPRPGPRDRAMPAVTRPGAASELPEREALLRADLCLRYRRRQRAGPHAERRLCLVRRDRDRARAREVAGRGPRQVAAPMA